MLHVSTCPTSPLVCGGKTQLASGGVLTETMSSQFEKITGLIYDAAIEQCDTDGACSDVIVTETVTGGEN